MKTIGVMSYQGAGHLHINALKKLGFEALSVYAWTDFSQTDGLILPGGESSVQYSYCLNNGLDKKILEYSLTKKPILGTCAGAILLSQYSSAKVSGFGLINMKIIRNFYGRQIKSTTVKSDNNNEIVFIRAPAIVDIGPQVTVFDTYKEKPVFVKQNNIYCTTFHPELGILNRDNVIYKAFRN